MPRYAVDLHNHTPGSADHLELDVATPRRIVERALDAGLHVYAATDHMSCAFADKVIAAAERVRVESGRELLVVPGCEFRITYRGDEAHIVALFEPGRQVGRFRTLIDMLGILLHSVPHAELPVFTFERDPVAVCRLIDALDGVACVAHADRWFGEYRLIDHPLFERLAAEPTVCAIDLIDPQASLGMVGSTHATLISCSDSHCCDRIGSRRSELEMIELTFQALRSALGRGNSLLDAASPEQMRKPTHRAIRVKTGL